MLNFFWAVRDRLFLEGPRLLLARARGQKRRVPDKGPRHNNLSENELKLAKLSPNMLDIFSKNIFIPLYNF